MSTRTGPLTHATPGRGRPRSPSWATIDLDAIGHNVRAVGRLLGSSSRVLGVVKANAYGHGAVPTAKAVLSGGAAGLAVASVREAAQLRRAGIEAPILVLCAGDRASARQTVRLGLIQTACQIEVVRALSRAAQQLGKPARVHLKIDTGMGRLGVQPGEVAAFAQSLADLPGIHIEGVFSHLATAEDPDATYAEEQFARFSSALASLSQVGIGPGLRHLCNSAATLRFPHMRLDAVRAGLLIYGIQPDAPGIESLDLRPALSWQTRLAFTQRLPAGRAISYGQTFVTRKESVVGVLPLGYADGYPRHASNRAHVLLRGRPCPVIGRVCMDHVIIDATPAGEPRAGDDVVLIGQQGERGITANQLAQWARTCVHEVPTVIGPRVARVYLNQP